MSTPPPAKRQKHSPPPTGTNLVAEPEVPPFQPPIAPRLPLDTAPPSTAPATSTSPLSPTNPRKRRASDTASQKFNTLPPGTTLPSEASTSVSIPSLLSEDSGSKKRPQRTSTGRTNTPWTATEEQRLKQMRDAGNSWGEIAKAFPNRTEGSVKKHWYKDMHYAEFAEDESVALREAIKEYEANKWKAIGQKLGKPAKACEQYAREHFKTL